MKKPILTHLSLSNLLLKALMLVASTASWSNWFHLFITLLEKKCLLLSRVHLTLTNLRDWPLVPLPLSSNWNSSSGLILLNPLQILNTSTRFRAERLVRESNRDMPRICWWGCSWITVTSTRSPKAGAPLSFGDGHAPIVCKIVWNGAREKH